MGVDGSKTGIISRSGDLCEVSAAGQSTVQFICPLQDSIFPFGWKACTINGKTLPLLSVKGQYL